MSEEDYINYIMVKLDIYLKNSTEKNHIDIIRDAVLNHLSEQECKIFLYYFFRLYQGYTKYRELNLVIDYHKMIEALARKNLKDIYPKQESIPTTDNQKSNISAELEKEIDTLTAISTKEVNRLHSFVIKFVISSSIIVMSTYILLYGFMELDMSGILLKIDRILNR